MIWPFCSSRPTVSCFFRVVTSLIGIGGLALTSVAQPPAVVSSKPQSKTIDHRDDYHGTVVADPYRWLEDVDSEDTKKWVEEQNKATFAYLDSLSIRQKLRERLTKLWNYERFDFPSRRGERYFFTHNNGLQNQSVLYTAENLEAARQVLLDANTLRDDGTIALAGWTPSDDGRFLAYGLAAAGSDWRTWHVRDVATGQDLEDKVEWVKFSGIAWKKDGSGFFYARYDEPKAGEQFTGTNYFQKLYFHKIGTAQSTDQLIYERPDQKEWGFQPAVSDDGAFLLLEVWRGTDPKNQLFYLDLQKPEAKVQELLVGFDAEYNFAGNDGSIFYVTTDNDAPLRRLVAIDINNPQKAQWKELIPQAKETLESVSLVGDTFFTQYLQDATSVVRLYQRDGTSKGEVALPGLGTVAGFVGRRSETETFYSFTNYITPPTIYRYDLATGASSVWRQPSVDFQPDQFTSERVFYTSKDGTKVPMILSYKKGVQRNGDTPTVLYGYGGFNNSVTPSFTPANLVWMEMGGIYAVANLRGGGEYGRAWHEAGMLDRKQNVFNDFIAAAEYLIAERYTQPAKLAIRGGSNGGLLVGAAITQRPDLFGAAIPAVGVMDMLRYHKFTIGWAWVNEYGSSDDPNQFKNLLAYSPLHNLKEGVCYPATLVTTADHDDRVVPGHSFKFAARLQAVQGCDRPTLIRIETRAGHGAGTPVAKLIEAATDIWAFVAENLKMQPSW